MHWNSSIFPFSEHECGTSRQQALGWHVSFIKYEPYNISNVTCDIFAIRKYIVEELTLKVSRSLAEFSRIPVVLTNQVRSQFGDESRIYSFQGMIKKLYFGSTDFKNLKEINFLLGEKIFISFP